MFITPPSTKWIVSHCWFLKHNRDKMSASRFLVQHKVHFLLRLNDLFRLNFVHIWGRRCHRTPKTLCSRNVSLFALMIQNWIKTRAGMMRMCSLFRLTKTNVGDRSQGRGRVSIIWLTAWAGRRVERVSHIGPKLKFQFTLKKENYA